MKFGNALFYECGKKTIETIVQEDLTILVFKLLSLRMIELRAILISAITDFYDAKSEYKSSKLYFNRGVDRVC